ncbi:30S ribosomal protein [Actinidia chinensis var. chinensis]|uniref:30S ribosomal protein n=1 Tax=Actinidia chinensis var. chinensis TaxID=1590841 RepID=A0A2R6QRR7_ACTCC|nr:30S ribosomal protein [Actinidia chinensis var. chinensis]
MATTPSHLKTNFNSLHVFSVKSPSSSSSSSPSSMKLKTLVQTPIARALSRAKSILIQVLKDLQLIHFIESLKKNKSKNKLVLGSFRLHYNWCSSHVLPTNHMYYDPSWNCCDDVAPESQLSGYLQWLEEKVPENHHKNEIDRLADTFIASCHEKFRLEKQESYRRFQEMMARSV